MYAVIMVRTQVSFDDDTYREAQREARRQGISFAEFCRRAIAASLTPRRRDRPWMRLAGALRSGDRRASRGVDDVVYGRKRP